MKETNAKIRVHHQTSGTGGRSLADYYPLMGVVGVVLLLTAGGVFVLEQAPMLAFMGYFFLVFGGLKVARLSSFVTAYREYDIPAQYSRAYAYAYPFLELGFAAAYLWAWQVSVVSAVVLVVMLISAAGVVQKLRRREEVPCACLGTVFTLPMTWVTLVEDLLMAGMAAWLLLV